MSHQCSRVIINVFYFLRNRLLAVFYSIFDSHPSLPCVVIYIMYIVEQISGKIWHNRGFNDKSVKTSKIVHLDLLNKIGYGPIT